MSPDSPVQIKKGEQWRWDEMKGVEMVKESNDHQHSCFKRDQEEGEAAEEEKRSKEGMEMVEHKSGSGAAEASSAPAADAKKSPTPPTLAFCKLFRYADRLDWLLMAIGTAGAIVHGCSLPIFLRFFANLVNSFGSNADDPERMMQQVVKV